MDSNTGSELIEMAITQAMKGLEDYDEGDMLIEWIVIGFATNPEKQKGDMYPMFVSNNNIPNHHARGLLTTGLKYYQSDAPNIE